MFLIITLFHHFMKVDLGRYAPFVFSLWLLFHRFPTPMLLVESSFSEFDRLAIWPPDDITPLPLVKWQNWKSCQFGKETTNQGEGKRRRPISCHSWASVENSPVQRLFGRRSKTLLPTAGELLQPKIVESTEEKLIISWPAIMWHLAHEAISEKKWFWKKATV